MTNADLDRIEAVLDLKLPGFYRRFMLDYPQHLAEQQPERSDVRRWELADDPDRVIQFNQEVREAGEGEFFDEPPPGGWPEGW